MVDAVKVQAIPAAGRQHGDAWHQAAVCRQGGDRATSIIVKLAQVTLTKAKAIGIGHA